MILHTQTAPNGSYPDTVLILDQREPFIQPIGFSDWNYIIASFRLSSTPSNQNNGILGEYDEFDIMGNSNNDPRKDFFFGLKYATPYFPKENNENFIGLSSVHDGARTIQNISDPTGSAYRRFVVISRFGRSEMPPSTMLANNSIQKQTLGLSDFYLHFTVKTGYQTANIPCFVSLHFIVHNKGLSNQFITMKEYISSAGFLRSYTNDNNSLQLINNDAIKSLEAETASSLSDVNKNFDWSISGLPLKLPNALFFYNPFTQWKLKVHQWSVTRIS